MDNLKDWTSLFKIAGISALVIVAFIPLQMVVFFVWPPPHSVGDWFLLFQSNWLIGLLDMDLLLIVDYVLLIFIYPALYFSLKNVNKSLMTIATVLAFIGTATYFSSTTAFEMLSLSNQYSTASTSIEKSNLLTAGQTMLVTWQGSAFNISYVLSAVALLIISVVMLKSQFFKKITAYTGIITGVLMIVPPTVGMIGIILSILSLIPMVVWLILISRRLLSYT
jgi:hypothetical protein